MEAAKGRIFWRRNSSASQRHTNERWKGKRKDETEGSKDGDEQKHKYILKNAEI